MKRDSRIDFLRSIATILIISAHIPIKNSFFEIRMFDVPLMAFLLGASYMLSCNRAPLHFLQYIKKRFYRLIIPAWIFLTLFFFITILITIILSKSFPYSVSTILRSYMLLDGIGYVWIIRVFFTIAIFSPMIYKLSLKISTFFLQLSFYSIAFLIQSLLCKVSSEFTGTSKALFDQLIVISFGYFILAISGFWGITQSKVKNLVTGLLFILLFSILAMLNNYDYLSSNKYPPTPYFLFYGLGWSFILLSIVSTEKVKVFTNKFHACITWISNYSLELYYWHILIIVFFEGFLKRLNWSIALIFILISTCLITRIQDKYIPNLFKPFKKKTLTKNL